MNVQSASKSTNVFIANYNELDAFFKDQSKDRELSFTSALADLSKEMAVVGRYKKKLQSFAKLRNAIIHDEKYPHRIIADPHADIVDEFTQIVSNIKNPKKIGDCCSRNPRIFEHNDSITDALRFMKENNYSQLVVKLHSGYTLLTAESIACWLEDNLEEILDFELVSLEH